MVIMKRWVHSAHILHFALVCFFRTACTCSRAPEGSYHRIVSLSIVFLRLSAVKIIVGIFPWLRNPWPSCTVWLAATGRTVRLDCGTPRSEPQAARFRDSHWRCTFRDCRTLAMHPNLHRASDKFGARWWRTKTEAESVWCTCGRACNHDDVYKFNLS